MANNIIKLEFGQVKILDQILIAELNEGVLFSVENNQKLLEIGREYFGKKTYVYISNRTYSYAVDPMVYRDSAAVDNLEAIAVVSLNPLTRLNAFEVEKKFYKDNAAFEVFELLEDAIIWAQNRLNRIK
ncbi:hypothetical protein ACW6QP_04565 [Salegentibacter sp. HM20]